MLSLDCVRTSFAGKGDGVISKSFMARHRLAVWPGIREFTFNLSFSHLVILRSNSENKFVLQ